MTNHPQNDDSMPSNRRAPSSIARVAARLSIVSAFVCFAFNCVANQLNQRHQGQIHWLLVVAGFASTAVVIGGVMLGCYAIWQGLKQREPDAWQIGLIGFVMNVGILLVMTFMLLLLRR